MRQPGTVLSYVQYITVISVNGSNGTGFHMLEEELPDTVHIMCKNVLLEELSVENADKRTKLRGLSQ
jgi:hypothetical protein